MLRLEGDRLFLQKLDDMKRETFRPSSARFPPR